MTHGAYLLFSWIGLQFEPQIHQAARDPFLQTTPSLDGLCRWDCGWYQSIAVTGYNPDDLHTANIWPGYPLLSRALSWLTGADIHYSLLVVSNLAGLVGLIVVYRVFLDTLSDNEAEARSCLMLFVAFPFHFFQAAAYPESLMVAASAGALLLALRGNPMAAGIVLGLGSLCRHLTLALGLGLLGAQVRAHGPSLTKLRFADPLGLVVPFLFPASFMVFEARRFGDPLAMWHSRDLWGPSAWLSVSQSLTAGVPDFRHRIYMALFVVLLFSAAISVWHKPWRVLGLAALPLLMILAGSGVEALGRYSASAWPAFLPLGVWSARRPALQPPLLGAMWLLQGLFFWMFSHQYSIL